MTAKTPYELPDGSVAVVEPLDETSSLVSRFVGGTCVWGQAFAILDGFEEERIAKHKAQVKDVVDAMRDSPHSFERPWDSQGRSR